MDAVVYNSVGGRSDAASATGSLHAKTKDIKDLLANKNIITYGTAIKSVQRGSASASVSPGNAVTISAVDTSKSMVIANSRSESNDTTVGEVGVVIGATATLTNSTTLTLIREDMNTVTPSVTVVWQVIEFY